MPEICGRNWGLSPPAGKTAANTLSAHQVLQKAPDELTCQHHGKLLHRCRHHMGSNTNLRWPMRGKSPCKKLSEAKSSPDKPSLRLPGKMRLSVLGSHEATSRTAYSAASGANTELEVCHPCLGPKANAYMWHDAQMRSKHLVQPPGGLLCSSLSESRQQDMLQQLGRTSLQVRAPKKTPARKLAHQLQSGAVSNHPVLRALYEKSIWLA